MSPDTIATLTIDGRQFEMTDSKLADVIFRRVERGLRRARLVYIPHAGGGTTVSVTPHTMVTIESVIATGAVELPVSSATRSR